MHPSHVCHHFTIELDFKLLREKTAVSSRCVWNIASRSSGTAEVLEAIQLSSQASHRQQPLTKIRSFRVRGQSFPTFVTGKDAIRGRCRRGTNLDDIVDDVDKDDIDAELASVGVETVLDNGSSTWTLSALSPFDNCESFVRTLKMFWNCGIRSKSSKEKFSRWW